MTCEQDPPRRPLWLSRLAGLSEPPHRTAAAFALGVFLSFSPLLGLQIAAAVGLALALRLNRIAVLIGLCTNMPWVMVPYYVLTTAIGAAMLGMPFAGDAGGRIRELLAIPVYRAAFWDRAVDVLTPFLWAFVLGSTLGAVVLGAVAYVVTVRVIAARRAQGGNRGAR